MNILRPIRKSVIAELLLLFAAGFFIWFLWNHNRNSSCNVDIEAALNQVLDAEKRGEYTLAYSRLRTLQNQQSGNYAANYDDLMFRILVKEGKYRDAAKAARHWREWMENMTKTEYMRFPLQAIAFSYALEAYASMKAEDVQESFDATLK